MLYLLHAYSCVTKVPTKTPKLLPVEQPLFAKLMLFFGYASLLWVVASQVHYVLLFKLLEIRKATHF